MMNQFILMRVMNYILKQHFLKNRDQYKDGVQYLAGDGYCAALSLLWAYSQWLYYTQTKTSKPRDDAGWFFYITDQLRRGMDYTFIFKDKLTLESEKKWQTEIDKNWAAFERFIELLIFFQSPQLHITKDENRDEVEQYFSDTLNRKIYKEDSHEGIYTEEELAKVLPCIFKKNTIILVSFLSTSQIIRGYGHRTAIFNHRYMDPNSEQVDFYIDYADLAKKIFWSAIIINPLLFIIPQLTIPIYFNVYNFYSNQTDVLSPSSSKALVPSYANALSPSSSIALPSYTDKLRLQSNGLYEFSENISPLYLAAANDNYDMVVYCLYMLKLDPNQPNKIGTYTMTPLYIASQNGYYRIVELLLQKGANPNTRRNDSKWFFLSCNSTTPLCIATSCGHIKTVKLLLQYGADPNISNENGMTPFEIAKKNGHTEIARLLHPISSYPICRIGIFSHPEKYLITPPTPSDLYNIAYNNH